MVIWTITDDITSIFHHFSRSSAAVSWRNWGLLLLWWYKPISLVCLAFCLLVIVSCSAFFARSEPLVTWLYYITFLMVTVLTKTWCGPIAWVISYLFFLWDISDTNERWKTFVHIPNVMVIIFHNTQKSYESNKSIINIRWFQSGFSNAIYLSAVIINVCSFINVSNNHHLLITFPSFHGSHGIW